MFNASVDTCSVAGYSIWIKRGTCSSSRDGSGTKPPRIQPIIYLCFAYIIIPLLILIFFFIFFTRRFICLWARPLTLSTAATFVCLFAPTDTPSFGLTHNFLSSLGFYRTFFNFLFDLLFVIKPCSSFLFEV
jgi:hypothetical protein